MIPCTWDAAALEAVQSLDSDLEHNGRYPRHGKPYTLVELRNWITLDFDSGGDMKDRAPYVHAIGVLALHELRNRSDYFTNERIASTLADKQRAYGQGNILAFGRVGLAVRISDKVERIGNMSKTNHESKVEPLLDSYLDIVGYAAIWKMLDKATFTLPLAPRDNRETVDA